MVAELHLGQERHGFVALGMWSAGAVVIPIGPGDVGNQIDERSADRFAIQVASEE